MSSQFWLIVPFKGMLYRVTMLVGDYISLPLILQNCPFEMPCLNSFHLPKQNLLERGTKQIKVNKTYYQTNHHGQPVLDFAQCPKSPVS